MVVVLWRFVDYRAGAFVHEEPGVDQTIYQARTVLDRSLCAWFSLMIRQTDHDRFRSLTFLAHDHFKHVAHLRAERETNAKLVSALRDGVSGHTVIPAADNSSAMPLKSPSRNRLKRGCVSDSVIKI